IVGTSTVNDAALLGLPPTLTTTEPDAAPIGTAVEIDVLLQLLTDATAPLKVTVPCVLLKPVPVMVNACPPTPDGGDREAMCGRTVKATPVLCRPLAVTVTDPVAAAAGTVTAILVSVQPVTV